MWICNTGTLSGGWLCSGGEPPCKGLRPVFCCQTRHSLIAGVHTYTLVLYIQMEQMGHCLSWLLL